MKQVLDTDGQSSVTWQGGWWSGANARPSPFYNGRPEAEVSLLVIHHISLPAGAFGGEHVDGLFMGNLDIHAHPSFAELNGLEVSAHFFIRRNGEIIQYVSCDDRAWHAGVSSFAGRSNCNDFSLGIELEGTGELAYTQAQYLELTTLTRAIISAYPDITPERICGHSDIAPGRKFDPGASFDWQAYRQGLLSST
ncbi:1,6-anhydro-N-acetylmuramyl-L-alanine amidase AmpD [Shewanella sp. NIFS-20-20]|uniref:1,6-anhydro-N-acetylmuramyl-L-alanine amidase AmpD n=1 Tax=Shewanella sp. NIFS-20-20 TaxID=2853806 RepID=UPI001C438FD2|nr:1,6-anhydro-N-acetylmuramyl-L-alanine amidase AmpD [Shewanella sp. NIFS-20-20]MBV7316469.1 1,6-anhydro-N-acetylmuramyl-L-alanine amidase AmpD [Shewanella sp. NIFS-20-20]